MNRLLRPIRPPRLARPLALACGLLAGFVPVQAADPAPPAAARAFYATPFERQPGAATLTALGRALFFDASLSASGRLACAGCHDPAHGYGPANARPVQLGGATLRQPGLRAVPSLKYQQNVPPFSEHYSEDDGDDSADQGPTGGRDWDGRASSAHEQAGGPLLSPFEMGNADAVAAVARLRASPNAERFRAAFGAHALDDPALAWNGLLLALEVFQQSPAEFYPYSSKYDAFLRHRVALSAAEARGLKLFNDPAKGNCAQCHISAARGGGFPQFTDFGLIALGVPRNPAIAANRDAAYFDLGACGPLRGDLRDRAEFCGLFKTPTLRNVALRRSFFHNGVYHRLEDAVRFYAWRDVRPERIYPKGRDGKTRQYDDLPARYRANLNDEPPFGGAPGAAPTLSERDIADIVAFLNTLTDGYAAP